MRNRLTEQGWFETKKMQPNRSIDWDDMTLSEEGGCARFEYASLSHESSESEADWVTYLSEALSQLHTSVEEKQREFRRLEDLTERIRGLECKLSNLPACESHYAEITDLTPAPLELLKPIKVVILKVDEDEYSATFYDGNLATAGCNRIDAFNNLKAKIVSRFEYLGELPEHKLGEPLRRQLLTLQAFIRKRG